MSRDRRDMLLKMSGEQVIYLLHDIFSGDLDAGAVNASLATPGGTGTADQRTRNVVDTGSKITVASGRLTCASGTGAADPRVYYGSFMRVAGLTAKMTFNATGGRGACGWATANSASSPTYGIYDNGGELTVAPPGATGFVQWVGNTEYTVWNTLFASGAATWIKGGTLTSPTLLWVCDVLNTTPMFYFPWVTRVTGAVYAGYSDDVQIKVIDSLSTLQKLATVYQDSPENGTNYTTRADALHRLTYAYPASPSDGDKIELRYRYQDVNNYWSASVTYNGGTSQWDFSLDEVLTAGTTNKIAVANVGATTEMYVVAAGNVHTCFTRASNTYTKRGNSVTDDSLNTAVEVGAWFGAGTISNLQSFARTWTL